MVYAIEILKRWRASSHMSQILSFTARKLATSGWGGRTSRPHFKSNLKIRTTCNPKCLIAPFRSPGMLRGRLMIYDTARKVDLHRLLSNPDGLACFVAILMDGKWSTCITHSVDSLQSAERSGTALTAVSLSFTLCRASIAPSIDDRLADEPGNMENIGVLLARFLDWM